MWQALEYGAVPVVEARASFKGCDDPSGWLRARARPCCGSTTGASCPTSPRPRSPTTPRSSAAAARSSRGGRRRSASSRASSSATRALAARAAADGVDAASTSGCRSVPLSDAQAARLRDGQRAFRQPREHWADNFEDSPWLPANECSKRASARCARPARDRGRVRAAARRERGGGGNCTHNGRVA